MSQSPLDQCVRTFYGAVGTPEAWPAALAMLAETFDATVGHLVWWDKTANMVQASFVGGSAAEFAREGDALYASHYGRIDVRRELAACAPVQDTQFCQQHFDAAYVDRSELYQDFLIPYEARYSAITKLADDTEAAVMLAVVRSQERGPFDDGQMALLRGLVPHIAQAASLHRKLTGMRSLLSGLHQTLDCVDRAVILIGSDGCVVTVNRAAEQLLSTEAGLRIVKGRLETPLCDDASALARLISEAQHTAHERTGGAGGSVAIRQADKKTPLYITVAPLAAPAASIVGHNHPCVALFVSDPDARPEIPAKRLMQIFHLTTAEARVAAGLCSGQSLDEISNCHGVSKNTVRAQIRAVFAKTDTSRQSELIRLLLDLRIVP